MRLALGIEYDGVPYHGWEKQKNGLTVQTCIELALSEVANQPMQVVCAGRTDAGVHACGQVVHMDTEVRRSMRSWTMGANANLPRSVSILWVKEVDAEFHARFSAESRHYRYIIFNRTVRPSLLSTRVTWEFRSLDVRPMHEAAQLLMGEHDFTAFRAAGCQAKNPVREISRLDVVRKGDFIIIDIEANAFLQHMVRNIAGLLMAIGRGVETISWARDVLEQRDRTLGGVTAPPGGLYLVNISYPRHYEIPKVSDCATLW